MELKGKSTTMSESTINFLISQEFGWLPSQIKNEDPDDIDDYLQILSMQRFLKSKEK